MTLAETIMLEDLERDPYPIYARLRDEEAVAFVPAVQLWLATRHDDVRHIDLAPEVFTGATDPSTLNRTMGVNMLGSEGPEQAWLRAIVEPPFRPRDVEDRTQGMILKLAHELIDGFVRYFFSREIQQLSQNGRGRRDHEQRSQLRNLRGRGSRIPPVPRTIPRDQWRARHVHPPSP